MDIEQTPDRMQSAHDAQSVRMQCGRHADNFWTCPEINPHFDPVAGHYSPSLRTMSETSNSACSSHREQLASTQPSHASPRSHTAMPAAAIRSLPCFSASAFVMYATKKMLLFGDDSASCVLPNSQPWTPSPLTCITAARRRASPVLGICWPLACWAPVAMRYRANDRQGRPAVLAARCWIRHPPQAWAWCIGSPAPGSPVAGSWHCSTASGQLVVSSGRRSGGSQSWSGYRSGRRSNGFTWPFVALTTGRT